MKRGDRPFSELSVAVTGHQPLVLGGYTNEVADRLVALARAWLAEHWPREVVSGLAAGWDMAVAKAALAESIPLVAALAFRGQADGWPECAKQEFGAVLSRAAQVYIYNEEKAHGCWTRRDRWVLERGEIVLALWSGIPSGTARAVADAQKRGRPVINFWDAWIATGGAFTPDAVTRA